MFRRARVHRARGETDRAIILFGRVIAARPVAPPVFLARAYVERAALLESSHDRAGAIESYRNASRVFGADARTRQLAARAVARLQAQRASSHTALIVVGTRDRPIQRVMHARTRDAIALDIGARPSST